jgi:hypothetical protein
MTITIEKVDNGYVLTAEGFGCPQKVFLTLDDVFNELLSSFEGRWHGFGGSMYGRVSIERLEPPVPGPEQKGTP